MVMAGTSERPHQDFMYQLQIIDFALVELTLYLDTHPDDLDAIKQYNTMSKQSQALKKKYEENVGALSSFGMSYSRHPFDYAITDWPWE